VFPHATKSLSPARRATGRSASSQPALGSRPPPARASRKEKPKEVSKSKPSAKGEGQSAEECKNQGNKLFGKKECVIHLVAF